MVVLSPRLPSAWLCKSIPTYCACAFCDTWVLCVWFHLPQVHTYDQVMFESVKTEGQFLHCSVRFFDDIKQCLHSDW